jgi:hypothetical protein
MSPTLNFSNYSGLISGNNLVITLYYVVDIVLPIIFLSFFFWKKKREEERSKWAEFCIAGVCPPQNLLRPPELADCTRQH